MNRTQYLILALDRLFTSIKKNGFWDDERQRIHGRLNCDANWAWKVDKDLSDRYGVFALSMLFFAKRINSLDTKKYDEKILNYLQHIEREIGSYSKSTLTYGAWTSLVLGKELYPNVVSAKVISQCFDRIMKGDNAITDNQDALFFIGVSHYLKALAKEGNKDVFVSAQERVRSLARKLLDSQDKDGFFQTGDLRALHHQRTLYVLWGLMAISEHMFKAEIKTAVEKSIEYLWNNRREKQDGGFLWHPSFYWVKSRFQIKVPAWLPKSTNYFFECHQTFFANTIILYQHFYETCKYENEKMLALNWIFGKNRINKNLTEATGLDIPSRIMTKDGRLFVEGNAFKGSYEVGSYIFALSGC